MKVKIAETDDTFRKTVIKHGFLGLKINGFHDFQVLIMHIKHIFIAQ